MTMKMMNKYAIHFRIGNQKPRWWVVNAHDVDDAVIVFADKISRGTFKVDEITVYAVHELGDNEVDQVRASFDDDPFETDAERLVAEEMFGNE